MGVIIAIPLTIRFFFYHFTSPSTRVDLYLTLGKNISHVPKSVPKKSPVFSCNGLFQIDYFDKNGFDDVGANECQ